MLNKNQIIDLYSYNDWANRKLLNAMKHIENEELIRDLSSSFRSIRDTMVHIIGTEELWLSRWKGELYWSLLNPDDFPTYTYLVDRWDNFANQIDGFLIALTEEDLMKEISYKNIKGISYSLEWWKQMLHVTNHSSYHRGQVVTMLRQVEKQPPSLDLIYYYLGER